MRQKKKKAKAKPVERSPWRRIHVDVRADVADAFGSLLLEEGALGLEIEDDETRAVPGKALMPTGRALITATFSRTAGLEARVVARLTALAGFLPEAKDVDVTWSDLWPEDWNAAFMAQWKPFRCGARTWVCPSWERDHFSAERVFEGEPPVVLYLDAGMAFGTGTHETTQLCVEAVEALARRSPAPRMLDVGTGTGILCFAALHIVPGLSAKGTDIDPVAVRTALENAKNNGVGERFTASADMPDADGAVYDVVIANILAGTLLELKEHIAGALRNGGVLHLSGVLVDQAPAVREGFQALGLVHLGTVERNGWVRIDLAWPPAGQS